jgi:hypothetical protein
MKEIRKMSYINLENAAFFGIMEKKLFLEMGDKKVNVPGYKAIIDKERNKLLSVVSSNYRLITNKEAYDLADYVVKEIFDGKCLKDFQCHNLIMPSTRSSCRIDLTMPNDFYNLFGNASESYMPFVRISNSYNKTLILKYQIGFCRYICLNGMIFGEKSVTFSTSHTGNLKDYIRKLVEQAKNKFGSISNLWKGFEQQMEILRDFKIDENFLMAIFCKVFDLVVSKQKEQSERVYENLLNRAKLISRLSKGYFNEHGNTAYAVMNILTDYASFPEWGNGTNMYVDGYQRRVGRWMNEFSSLCVKGNFDMEKYLGKSYLEAGTYLNDILKKEKEQLTLFR